MPVAAIPIRRRQPAPIHVLPSAAKPLARVTHRDPRSGLAGSPRPRPHADLMLVSCVKSKLSPGPLPLKGSLHVGVVREGSVPTPRMLPFRGSWGAGKDTVTSPKLR